MTRAITPARQGTLAVPDADASLIAEALASIRADHLFDRAGVADPHAHLFASEAGRRLAADLEAADRVFVPYVLARYRFFSEKISRAAERYRQVLLVGSGYDTRPLWLPGLREGRTIVFEVEEQAVLDRKALILAENGIRIGDSLVTVGAPAGDDYLPTLLTDAGFDRDIPAAVFYEGLLFHLSPTATRHLLDPRHVGLAAGSSMTFDYWPSKRVRKVNADLAANGSRKLFGQFPFADDPHGLSRALTGIGHGEIAIVPLATLAERLWLEENPYRPHGDWRVITTEVA
jgi:methyltransferase (TIGR00027 family)